MNIKRHFRFEGKKTAPLVWEIIQDGDSYTTRHGMLGGAIQESSDTPGPKGKPGTKGYMDAEANCRFNMDREIRKKEEHGYIEYVAGKPLKEQITEIRGFDRMLPKNFCGYKPQTSIEDSALEKLHKAGKARYTRKYDGMCHLLVHHTSGWEIYTRRMDLATDRFPEHIKELEKTGFGPGTVIVAEAVCYDKSRQGREDFKAISSFCRSLPEETRKIVAEGKVPEPALVIFDFLFHEGKDMKTVDYDTRSKFWKDNFKPADKRIGLIASVDYYDVTPASWQEFAKKNGWEGFVVTDGSAVPGDKFYSFDGDAKRPKGHHKLKPIYEDDVVIFAGAPGTGKRLGGIGAVHVKQIHPETKKWMYCGKVGSGFTDEDLAELEKLCKKNDIPIVEKDKDVEKMNIDNHDGLVAMIEYGERQPGTQKFRFPVFMRVRTDKAVKECVAQRLAADEE